MARGKVRRNSAKMGSTAIALALNALTIGVGGPVYPAQASISPQERKSFVHAYEIPAGSMGAALNAFADRSELHVLYDSHITERLKTPGLSGAYSVRDGLDRLLSGSGLSYRLSGNGRAVSIILAQAGRTMSDASPRGATALPPIEVGADHRADNAGNGSGRGAGKTAYAAERGAITEGSGSYTTPLVTVAGKTPLPRKEIPQSVSVMTRAQMNDMQLNTVQDAMFWMPGVSAISNDVTQSQPASRGYVLDVANDGVPSYSGLAGYQQLDLAVYDRLEVLKGPAGLLSGSGSPGGVLNVVKKRPRDEFKIRSEFSAGSWDNYRGMVDVTGPINEDRTLRYRALVLHQARHFFFEPSRDGNKWVGYGALEYDITPDTLANVSYTRQRTADPAYSGQPVAAIPFFGQTSPYFLDAPRSWNPYPDWANYRWDTEDKTIRIEHRFGGDWVAKVNFNRRDQAFEFDDAYPTTGVNPSNWRAQYAHRHFIYWYHRTGVDSYLSGSLPFLPLKNALTLGYNYDRFSYEHKGAPAVSVNNIPVFWPNALGPNLRPFSQGGENQTLQHGAYAQFRVTPIEPLTFVFGGRLTNFFAKSRAALPSMPGVWRDGAKANHRFTPYIAGIYRLTDEINLYGGYTDIFIPQTQQRADRTTLDPRIGGQIEAGVKGEFLDKKLNTSVAWFDIRDQNRSFADPANPGYFLQAGLAESYGVEVEFSGKPFADYDLPAISRPLPGLDVVGGYTYMKTALLADRNNQGRPINSWYPTHMFKIWGKYDFDGELKGFTVGAGVVAQSGLSGAVNSLNEARHGPAYAVVNAMAAYKLNDYVTLQVNLNNLTDQKYYTRVGGANTYNTPGEPRNFMVTLRGEY
jgi:outer membrane receptor for ferric coprogen and ferric-rhodotorulic acid